MTEEGNCWNCAYFIKTVNNWKCQAEVKGGTMYTGWKPPCKNWKEKKKGTEK